MELNHPHRIAAIIPARLHSTRLPRKVLAQIGKKSMLQHVYDNLVSLGCFKSVIIAADTNEIIDHVASWGGSAVLTSPDHICGTDRIAEVAASLSDIDYILNVQGDEPLVGRQHIDPLLHLLDNPGFAIGTASTAIHSHAEMQNPNVVKLVKGIDSRCLYFSRAAIPYDRDLSEGSLAFAERHIGMYLFRKDVLLDIVKLPVGNLELVEKLEQLRWLEYGYHILAAAIPGDAISVDTPEDLERVRALLA